MGFREKIRDNGRKLKHKSFGLDVRRHFFPHEDSQAEAQVVHRGGAVSILGGFQLPTG